MGQEMKLYTPPQGDEIIQTLWEEGYFAYYVGGCVRDSILGREPKDWDIATSATPDEVKQIFSHVIPTGEKHGTVTVVYQESFFEVTTFRTDGDYSDGRRPDSVEFVKDIKSDLARRDFTINAMAYNPVVGRLIDSYGGMKDLASRMIRAVGKADERIKEDALRMMRGIRFSSTLDFACDTEFLHACSKHKHMIKNVSPERIRDELCKILMSPEPEAGIGTLYITGLLEQFLPELAQCFGFDQQNPHHNKDVGDHILAVVQATPADLKVRVAALFHDIGKVQTFTLEVVDGKSRGRFFGHQTVGAGMACEIMMRLKFPNEMILDVCALVRDHMSRIPHLRPKNIKRLINRVGEHNIRDLIYLMKADVEGHKPPHDFTNLDDMITEVETCLGAKEPMSMKDLAINGNDLIAAGFKPGPVMGNILKNLLEAVLDNPELNTEEKLLEIVRKGVGNFIDEEIN
jgi:tRNA nucleotidyltransferase (CCA-adding enzyme)